ncbi:ribosomal protein S4 [Candidatus Phytoplasma oryzae]|uniref:Small ribosomal subunit protein uS4 n=1 Tax=Candidatus Phytoplasma oryzae TaxID=203274 RepID=A0A139JQM2_9MOLU|nr:30S ribosomal protein S4 [Candidatus Phytoplasma oryzae]KXT29281.1 ribosomal protein S4 [Candidatus Phytoplasma oryzae]RAM57683.1 30S ribosomal protein S4 [Candidatus Phytoplasma oryzae]
MSHYKNPLWKVSRRLNFSLSETGKELNKKNNAILEKQKKRKSKLSDYSVQLQEKQKVRLTYGISEKQFKKVFHKASKMKGIHGENFLILLESRLDNIIYRLNIAKTRAQAKQLISHGHVLVDFKKVDICSYILKPGQQISIKEKSKNLEIIQNSIKNSNKIQNSKKEYIILDSKKIIGKYIRYPERNEFLTNINEQLIVEFYNR